jgi:hypothetical protein
VIERHGSMVAARFAALAPLTSTACAAAQEHRLKRAECTDPSGIL